MEQRFPIGINYWPARAALDWWHQFDPGVIGEDFGRIAAAGFDIVRFFLTWEAFQPTTARVDPSMLAQLGTTADLAGQAGLKIMPTLFTGHMSGVNLLPSWAVDAEAATGRFRVVRDGRAFTGRSRSWFDDDDIVSAQARLASACAATLHGHPALLAWDLGNENSNCSVPSSRQAARAWLERVTGAIRDADPTAAVTIGLHMEDLESNRQLGPLEAAATCDFLSMHGYPIYAPWAAGPLDHRLLAFLTEITRWLGRGVDVMFTELGLPTHPDGAAPASAVSMLVDEHVAADYTRHALSAVQSAGATGAMLWCANDYVPEVWATPPFDSAVHERSFGLWRADGSAKPAVGAVTDHVDRMRYEAPTDVRWIDMDPDDFYTTHGSHLRRLYERYCAAGR